ncbi:MAG: hypothetical protein ACTHK7_13475 [Aureliella sp.]
MTEPENPYAAPVNPPTVSLEQAAANDRPMFAQILVVGILQTVVGALELLVGGMFIFMCAMIPLSVHSNGAAPAVGSEIWIVTLIYGGIGAGAMLSGCLRLASGIGSFYFRYRPLMLVSLIFGLVSSLTCYCALTATPLAVYGMIIMCSPTAKRAFALRKAGMLPAEIRRTFNA